ncbi:MAG: glutathione S-transferase family protein, partial [Flavobacteriaceae bacterium]
ARDTPTLQVPTLWDGGRRLWESTLIAEYLLETYDPPPAPAGQPPLAGCLARATSAWEDRLLMASVQTLGTAATTVSQLTWTGVGVADNDHLARCAARIGHLLDWLEGELGEAGSGFFGDAVSAQDIFLACHLRFIAARPLGINLAPGRHPRIAALLDRLDRRASFAANPVLWWDPAVTGYDEAGTPLYGG